MKFIKKFIESWFFALLAVTFVALGAEILYDYPESSNKGIILFASLVFFAVGTSFAVMAAYSAGSKID